MQALSLPNMGLKEPFITALSEFSKSLHANAFNEIFTNLDKTKSALQSAKNSDRFKGLDNILSEVEFILNIFDDIKNTKENYRQHYKFAKFMFIKGYYLISATYISEAILLYALERFKHKGFMYKPNSNMYHHTNAIKLFTHLCATPQNNKDYLKVKDIAYKKCKYYFSEDEFDALENNIRTNRLNDIRYLQSFHTKIANIRNDLVHIDTRKKNNISEIPSTIKVI